MERITSRKAIQGVVVKIANAKTITVAVETYKKHPLYSKRFKSTKKYQVHDEKGVAQLQDIVNILETRPISKTKHFRLERIIKKHKDGE